MQVCGNLASKVFSFVGIWFWHFLPWICFAQRCNSLCQPLEVHHGFDHSCFPWSSARWVAESALYFWRIIGSFQYPFPLSKDLLQFHLFGRGMVIVFLRIFILEGWRGLHDLELEELTNLLSCLGFVTLSNSHDREVWLADSSGPFTCRILLQPHMERSFHNFSLFKLLF